MRFERLRLMNFKCYENVEVRLDRGVTVIHGLNGSGKSSLLEACFFALYGSKALDARLDEIVTIGAEKATVELWFKHDGSEYHIERRIHVRDESARTTKCVLETPDSDGTIEGATDVRNRIGSLLRMDDEAFVNCAYVRQGEVNKLINATPSQRQDMIDDLLQLGRLEDYRERASDARVGVGRVRDNKEGELTGLIDQIEEKEESNLHARLNECQTERTEIVEEIDRIETKREKAITTRDHEQQVIEEADEQRSKIETLADDIEDLQTSIETTERERNTMSKRLREERESVDEKRDQLEETLETVDLDGSDPKVEERIDTLETRDEELLETLQEQQLSAQEQSNRATQLEETAEEHERQAEEARENVDELETTLEERNEILTERHEKLESLRTKRSEKLEQFESAPCELGSASEHRQTVSKEQTELREREAERRSELSAARDAVEEAEQLQAEGKCPECGQPVDGSPHVEAIEERRERVRELESALDTIETEREAADERLKTADTLVELEADIERLESEIDTEEQLIENEKASVSKERDQCAELRETADTHVEKAQKKREEATEAREQAADCRSTIGEINAERQTVNERIERLETIESLLDDIDTAETEIERLRTRREELEELNTERRESVTEKRQQKQDLEEQFDEARIEKAKENKTGAERYIEWADDKLSDLAEKRDTLQGHIGAIQNEIETLEELRERQKELTATVERLTALYEETEQLQTMYAELRSELRQRNVQKLERLLNDTFGLLYQNDSYARIELDGDYELTVYQKDGEVLDPEQLSGGERALFNLSLRCAVYRLLAEGIDGAAPMPPLILDEPTVFLDSGHVSKLLDLVTSMREIGVEQIVVVSHDDELVGAADDLVNVAKDPTTNRSTIERRKALSV
ncbi:DNA double-strand break repair ATPase Rad50 [Halocatena marina]|uniref:DNA double-strand break repair ATPase Rad50 n=1 Tax=Halocatena marina TaxID=2934937 RepID=UPI0022249513|nr:DNA double-strand break repair ATPase Rad50 [Halocatena marina]